MTKDQILLKLRKLGRKRNIEGMRRFGIQGENMLGVSVTTLRRLKKNIPKNHKLALELYDMGIHEAKILASMLDEVELVTEKQMDRWVSAFDSWDVCDGVCMNLFCYTPFVNQKIYEYALNKKEFVRRTAFTLIACLACRKKDLKDKDLIPYFSLIKKYSFDERNFVKKAVNWALRQLGKRNLKLNKLAIKLSKELIKSKEKHVRWIGSNALVELKSEAVQKRLKKEQERL